MASEKLRTTFKDDILRSGQTRKYNMTQNSDGTVSFEDVTDYAQIGDSYGASQINQLNETVNGLIDGTSNIDNTADSEKHVAYAASAGTAETAGSVSGDFILLNKGVLSFNAGNICTISDLRITSDSLADVYFTENTIQAAEKAVITVETYSGRVELVARRAPEGEIKASIRIRTVG